ncbi:head maturation protease, ClpP-related [Streptomyces sp. NRRL S-337]|uniref:head maturation protease, ClpP-related n=1 Tax=Streptomyces sp. NRRL S-337 TaxID=1463900 RepID=UPI00068FF3E3|nr:head maturation protease, ClpP-related [Streptomyces sp. NRRL S-337]
MHGKMRSTRPVASLRQGRTDWYRITNLGQSAAEVVIYDEIGYFGVTAEDFMSELRDLDVSAITLRVNSPGGEIFDGIAIHNLLRSHRAYVTTYVDSLAASIASVIALAGDRVIMQPHSQMMIHDGSGLAIGNASDMRETADLLDRQSDNIAGIYAERAGGTPEEWRERMRAETWYTAAEAVAAGLADEVAETRQRPDAEPDQPEPALANSWDLSLFRYAGRSQAPDPAVPAPVDTASSVHHTATEDSSWDGPAAVAKMPNDGTVLKATHAWRDPDGDPDAKATYKFPHHREKGGAANLAACRNGLARLDSADVPDGERAGVRAHLEAHLSDGNAEDRADTELTASAADGTPAGQPDATVPDTATAQDTKPPTSEDTVQDVSRSEDTPADDPTGDDDWAAMTARLIPDDADDWSALVSNLTTDPASSSAADA